MAKRNPSSAARADATLAPDPIPAFDGLPPDIQGSLNDALCHLRDLGDLIQSAGNWYDAPGVSFLGECIGRGVEEVRAVLMMGPAE